MHAVGEQRPNSSTNHVTNPNNLKYSGITPNAAAVQHVKFLVLLAGGTLSLSAPSALTGGGEGLHQEGPIATQKL